MACTLNIPSAFFTNHLSFVPPPSHHFSLVPPPSHHFSFLPPPILPSLPSPPPPAVEEIFPQSLGVLKFQLVGRLVPSRGGATAPDMMQLCDDLQSCWNPASTWRVVSLGDGFFSLQFSGFRDCRRISVMASSSLKNGTMRVISTWAPEYEAYKDRTTGPSITLVRWLPPPPFWIKANTDGSARGRPGRSSCGGVFRDWRGTVVGCFSQKLGLGFALEAELSACVLALDIAHHRGWNKIWLESDSTDVVELLASRSTAVPEKLKESWMRVLEHLTHMEFRVTHIYREGNRVADAMANADAENWWWPHVIPAISELVYDDAVGCFNTRTRL